MINEASMIPMIENILEEFKKDNSIIYDGSGNAESFRYERLKNFKKPIPVRTCIYPNCTNITIKNSHTIQKSGPLKKISEQGHVIGPIRNWKSQEMTMLPIGLQEASTFPGYCKEHERIFESFERTGIFLTERDITLQLYRTVCRETVEIQYFNDEFMDNIDVYIEYRNKKLLSILKNRNENIKWDEKLHNCILKELTSRINNLELHDLYSHLNERKQFMGNYLIPLQNGLINDIESGKHNEITVNLIRFMDELPVTLATVERIDFESSLSKEPLIAIFNVLPSEKYTYIFLASIKRQRHMLELYGNSLYFPINCLNRVESMILGNLAVYQM